MIRRICLFQPLPRAASAVVLLVLGVALNGCASVGDSVSLAFAEGFGAAAFSRFASEGWCGRWESNPHDVAIEGF